MGLSAFNAMRARMTAEAKALGSAGEMKPSETVEGGKEDGVKVSRKTDAEKLKKKRD